MSTQRLPLDVIQVAEPCTESWHRMSGDDRVRYCAGCRKHVYNLAAMSRGDAERLVCEGAGSLCVRFARCPETGQVQTLEYGVPPAKRRGWRFWTAVSTVAASVVAGAHGYLIARGRPAPGGPTFVAGRLVMPVPPVMGMVATPPAPPSAPPAGASPQQPSPAIDDSGETAAG